jgi:hypothetical protein
MDMEEGAMELSEGAVAKAAEEAKSEPVGRRRSKRLRPNE